MLDTLLAEHVEELLLGGALMGHVIEHKNLFLGVGLHHKFVLLLLRQVHTPRELVLAALGLEADHNFHLFLPVHPTTSTHL